MLVNHASADSVFSHHPGLLQHGLESYVGVPLFRRDGTIFGTLCALDSEPANLSKSDMDVMHLLAQLIAFELEAEEQQQKGAAQLRAMEDFIAVAAHDLRQPLTALLGRAQLLARRARQGGPVEGLLPGIETLAVQTRRAIQLSDKLLDVARIETGEFQLGCEMLDLVELAQETLDDAQMNAPNHTFVFQAPPALPLYGDSSRLGQVLRNLLDNAAKYTPAERGPVELVIEQRQNQAGASFVRIQISDSGIGVSDADLARLFDRMYRASSATKAGISGTGLGLFISKQIVDAHGGTIEARHNPGGGLMVVVTLPDAEPGTRKTQK